MPKSKIIKELVNDEISLEKALHRVIVLAKDLKDTRLEEWAKSEIKGYDNPKQIPEYRRVKLRFVGVYLAGISSIGYTKHSNAQLHTKYLEQFSEKERQEITTYKMSESVRFLTHSLDKDKKLGIPVPPDLMSILAKGTNTGILSANREINESEILRILAEVKTRALDVLCELEDKFGCLDDMDISNSDDKIKSEARQNIEQIIICDTYNNMEIGDGNTIKKSNFLSKLFKKLKGCRK